MRCCFLGFSGFLLLFGGVCLPAAEGADGGEETGVVRQVVGDLAYVEGLNESAPLWSRLKVVGSEGAERAALEVIKELDEVLVARVVSENGVEVKVADRVIRVARTGSAEGRTRRVMHATQVDRGPRLDGQLDDPVWQEASPVEGLVQRDPGYWVPCTERTVIRIVYDEHRIYFGFECFASGSEQIVANNMRRDAESISSDDNVQILLDTYNDRQTGFFFFVNPLGAKRDLLLSDEGRTYNGDWDCNWIARTRRHSKGWSAEVAIPFDQLRFKQSEEMVWGINLARRIGSKNEEAQFVVGRRSSSRLARYWTSDLAELRGLTSIRSKRLLQVKPYVLPGSSTDLLAADPSEKSTFEVGGDVRFGITSNMVLDISYNTDFAQVEGDQEQVNLTQFQLFFPEKREFFLEGANLFDFGEAAERRGGDDKPPTLLFYSRRIGLEEKRQVPIVLGTKLVGKAGRTSIGALNVLMDSQRFQDGNESLFMRRSNFSVFRMKHDLFARSNVGFIFVNKQTDDPASGWGVYNRAGGLDFSFSPTVSTNVKGFAARTWDSGTGKSDGAGFAQATYARGIFSARGVFLDIGDNFEPAAGFVNRRSGLDGFRRYQVRTRLRPRPNAMTIRYISIGPEFQLITDRENRVKFWEGEVSWWTQFNTGDFARIEMQRQHDVVEKAFKPSRRKDLEVPPGAYTFTTFATGPSTSRGRKLRLRLTLQTGGYYTGHRHRFAMESAYRPGGRFNMETEYDSNWIRLPGGNLNVQTLSNRLIYSITTDFFVKLFAQWNNDKEQVSGNVLLNYRFRPGSDLYFVYDHGFGTEDGLQEQNRAVLLKLSCLVGL